MPRYFILSCYTALVAYASLRPATTSGLDPWDKLGHFVVYTLFAVLAGSAARTRRELLLLCIAIAAYGGLLEILQSFQPGRVMSLGDFLANAGGVLLGGLAAIAGKSPEPGS